MRLFLRDLPKILQIVVFIFSRFDVCFWNFWAIISFLCAKTDCKIFYKYFFNTDRRNSLRAIQSSIRDTCTGRHKKSIFAQFWTLLCAKEEKTTQLNWFKSHKFFSLFLLLTVIFWKHFWFKRFRSKKLRKR